MRWLEAHDLAQWGGTRDGRKAPELVSRLILAVHGPAAALRISRPTIAFNTPVGTEYAMRRAIQHMFRLGSPSGRLALKERNSKGKHKLTTLSARPKPLGVNPSETCFFFVTPQRWPHKDVWAARRRAEGVWRDVRVIDGDTLVHWLELYPGVSEWLAVRINRRPEGLRNLDDIWNEWSGATVPL